MHPIIPRLAPIAAALLLAGCSSATATVEDTGVRASANRSGVHVTNRTTRPVFTVVIGRHASALVLLEACVDPERCSPLAPGESRTSPRPQPATVTGNLPEHEAIVFWWHRADHPDGARPDSIRHLLVPLR